MTPRVSPTEQLRAEIDELFAASDGQRGLGDTLEDVARLGARLLLQTALEAEVTEFLCRNSYKRRTAAGDAPAGSRNGYSDVSVKTTAGAVSLKRPKPRGRAKPSPPACWARGVTRTIALESLVIAGFVRGCRCATWRPRWPRPWVPRHKVSKSTVSRVCEAIKGEFDAFKARSLADVELEYLFLDGSHLLFHAGAKAEPVLVAWGITTPGRPVLLHLVPGTSESTDAWVGFLANMAARGLRPPLLVVSDGAPGLIAACEVALGHSARQRCLIRQSSQEPCGQGAQTHPGPGQGRVLGHLRRHRGRPWHRGGGRGQPAGQRPSPPSGASSTPRRSTASRTTSATWSPTCASRKSTGGGSAIPTSSSAPSARPAAG